MINVVNFVDETCEDKCLENNSQVKDLVETLMISDLAHECMEYFTPCLRCTWFEHQHISRETQKLIEFYLGRLLFSSNHFNCDFHDQNDSQSLSKSKEQELLPFFIGNNLDFIKFILSDEKHSKDLQDPELESGSKIFCIVDPNQFLINAHCLISICSNQQFLIYDYSLQKYKMSKLHSSKFIGTISDEKKIEKFKHFMKENDIIFQARCPIFELNKIQQGDEHNKCFDYYIFKNQLPKYKEYLMEFYKRSKINLLYIYT